MLPVDLQNTANFIFICNRKRQIIPWRCYHNREWNSETRRRENNYCVYTLPCEFMVLFIIFLFVYMF